MAQKETRRVFNPSCSLCEQFILCPFLLRKKMDEEFESLQTNSYIQKEKAQRKNPCAFSGAEGDSTGFQPVVFALRTVYFMSLFALQKDGRRVRVSPSKFIYKKKKHKGKILVLFLAQKETRRVFNPSCSLCEQFILCPFLLCKKMDEEFESLQTNSYIQKKKAQRKNPCAFSGAEGDSTGFQPVVFALRTVYFMSLFALQKMDEEFESLQTNSYIQKKKHKGKILVLFPGAEGETRTLAPVTRPTPLAGAPRHQLEYFCIGSVYDTIRLLKERAENPLSLLSGGESGIRTHGTLPYDGFQDRSVITTSVSLRIRRKL